MKKAFKVFLWDQSENEEEDEHVGENEDVEDGDVMNDITVCYKNKNHE